jgi:hypothetical protein
MSSELKRPILMTGAVAAVLFAAVHVYWAFGGRVGVPDDAAPISSRPWFLAYDIAAAMVFLIAGWMGWCLANRRDWPWSWEALRRICFWGGVLAFLRGGLSLGASIVMGELDWASVFDVIFIVGGVLFLLGARGVRNS